MQDQLHNPYTTAFPCPAPHRPRLFNMYRNRHASCHSYRKVAMESDEVIVGVFLPNPRPRPFEFVRPYKQARRREDDISIVTSGMRVRLEPQMEEGKWVVVEADLCFGGMAATTVAAPKTEVRVGACMCPFLYFFCVPFPCRVMFSCGLLGLYRTSSVEWLRLCPLVYPFGLLWGFLVV